jgi:hypothetical protein
MGRRESVKRQDATADATDATPERCGTHVAPEAAGAVTLH